MLQYIGSLLRAYLWYLTYLSPVVRGAQLCQQANPDPAQVTNTTLTLILGWAMEVLDVLLLSQLFAVHWICTLVRIVLCLYFAHPKFLGASTVYSKLLAPIVTAYGPILDSLVLRHLDAIAEWGIVHYAINAAMSLMRGVAGVFGIARKLLEAGSDTSVPAAPLPRRLSQERRDSLPQATGESAGAAAFTARLATVIEATTGASDAVIASWIEEKTMFHPAPPQNQQAATAARPRKAPVMMSPTFSVGDENSDVASKVSNTPPRLAPLQVPFLQRRSSVSSSSAEGSVEGSVDFQEGELFSYDSDAALPPAHVRQDRSSHPDSHRARGLRNLPDLNRI